MNGLRARLEASDLIRAKVQDNGLVSYNFTTKAFINNNWDAQTVTARGLFMGGNRIVGRGYPKFFNLDQPHGYTKDDVRNIFTAPITVSLKRNGFLGIMFAYKGELLLWSKSGETDYSKEATELFLGLTNPRQRAAIYNYMTSHNVSFTWEIVLNNDPHVAPEKPGMYLLDAIRNTEAGELATEELLLGRNQVAQRMLGLRNAEESKEQDVAFVGVFEEDRKVFCSGSEALEFLESQKDVAGIEGYVLSDAEGRMSKVKLDYYLDLKKMRTTINRAMKGRGINLDRVPEQYRDFAVKHLTRSEDEVKALLSDVTVKNVAGDFEVSLPLFYDKFVSGAYA